MVKCKYCNIVEIKWPENYVKGNKPLEAETSTEHTKERCEWFKNGRKNPIVTRQGGFMCAFCNKSFHDDYQKYANHRCCALNNPVSVK